MDTKLSIDKLAIHTIEECAELTHIIVKSLRFGWFNYHPNREDKIPNIINILKEIKDVKECITLLESACTDILANSNNE